MSYYENLYYYAKYAVYALYVATFFGLWNEAPIYLTQLNYYLKLFVSITLVILFNPLFGTKTFTTFHKRIAFSAGFILLTSMTLTGIKNQLLNTYNLIVNRTSIEQHIRSIASL